MGMPGSLSLLLHESAPLPRPNQSPETETEPLASLLYKSTFIHNPEACEVALASSLLVGLDATAIGWDLTIDGTASTQFVDYSFQQFVSDTSDSYRGLLASLAHNNMAEQSALREDALVLVYAAQNEFDITAQTIKPELLDKFRVRLSEYIHHYWDNVPLPYEGGDKSWRRVEIFPKFCQLYQAAALSGGYDLPGWSRQVRVRFGEQLEHDSPPYEQSIGMADA